MLDWGDHPKICLRIYPLILLSTIKVAAVLFSECVPAGGRSHASSSSSHYALQVAYVYGTGGETPKLRNTSS